MQIDKTDRGFGLGKFVDAAGRECSIQDSSLASEACLWLGVAKMSDGRDATRMHLTTNKARKVAMALKAALAGDPVEGTTFVDRYGSTCVIVADGLDEKTLLAVGVAIAFEGQPALPMLMGREQIETVMPALLAFVSSGHVSGEIDPDVLIERPRPPLDVKIPKSMLARADVGETGVSTRELLDAFRRLFDYCGGDLTSGIGQDDAEAIEALYDRLKPIPEEA